MYTVSLLPVLDKDTSLFSCLSGTESTVVIVGLMVDGILTFVSTSTVVVEEEEEKKLVTLFSVEGRIANCSATVVFHRTT